MIETNIQVHCPSCHSINLNNIFINYDKPNQKLTGFYCNDCEKHIEKSKAIFTEKNIVKNENDDKLAKCPLCQKEMQYTELKKHGRKTHLWICPECPGVTFEYWDKRDILRVFDYYKKK
jgi:transposase-like protein